MSKNGNCYEVAALLCVELGDEATLVHGDVWHPNSGWHGHAWIELGDEVIDKSNGHDVKMPILIYYALGHVCNVYRYNYRKTMNMLIRYDHYGPWEE